MSEVPNMLDVYSKICARFGKKAMRITPTFGDNRSLDNLARLVSIDTSGLENIDQHPHVDELCAVLPYLWNGNVRTQYGEETLLLVIQKLQKNEPFGELVRRLRKSEVIDFEQLAYATKAAQVGSRMRNIDVNVERETRANYFVLDRLKKEVQRCELEKILKGTAKGIALSDKRLNDYQAEITIPLLTYGKAKKWGWFDEETMTCYKVFVDGMFGIMLMYKGKPNAIVSFMVDDCDKLKITQLQGIRPYLFADGIDLKTPKDEIPRGSSRGLAILDFRRTLLELGKYMCTTLGLDYVGIQSGHNNPRTREDPKDGKVHLTLRNALMVYDEFADDNGFTQDLRTKDWYRALDV